MSTEPTELDAQPTDAADATALGPVDADEAKSVAGRRRFLRWFGVSASGIALANTIDTSKEKIEAGGARSGRDRAAQKGVSGTRRPVASYPQAGFDPVWPGLHHRAIATRQALKRLNWAV